MFTGIVEEIGFIKGIKKTSAGAFIEIKCSLVCSDIKIGDSIAVNGVCLSVISINKNILGFDVIKETLIRTTLGELSIKEGVNLERSLKADSRMGGHFVSGHIDCKAKIDALIKDSNGVGFKIFLPDGFSRFITDKGSIALDGVSLTLANSCNNTFTVYLIPHTLKTTTLGNKKKGGMLNIETDILAKYAAQNIQQPSLQDLLKKYEYI